MTYRYQPAQHILAVAFTKSGLKPLPVSVTAKELSNQNAVFVGSLSPLQVRLINSEKIKEITPFASHAAVLYGNQIYAKDFFSGISLNFVTQVQSVLFSFTDSDQWVETLTQSKNETSKTEPNNILKNIALIRSIFIETKSSQMFHQAWLYTQTACDAFQNAYHNEQNLESWTQEMNFDDVPIKDEKVLERYFFDQVYIDFLESIQFKKFAA